MSAFNEEKVLTVHHWTDRLFTFTTSRDRRCASSNGHFTMIGLQGHGKPLLRAYSIASPNYEDHLEFLSKVRWPADLAPAAPPDRRHHHPRPQAHRHLGDRLPAAGQRLYLFSTGTGLGAVLEHRARPRDLRGFDQVEVVHGVRQVDELAYHDWLAEHCPSTRCWATW